MFPGGKLENVKAAMDLIGTPFVLNKSEGIRLLLPALLALQRISQVCPNTALFSYDSRGSTCSRHELPKRNLRWLHKISYRASNAADVPRFVIGAKRKKGG